MTPEELLETWKRRVQLARRTHYLCAVYWGKVNHRIGIPVVILTAIVGSAVFASLEQEVVTWVRVVVGTISMIAAVLAALHTFLQAAERAARHHRTAADFMDMQREIERHQTFWLPEGELKAFVEELSKRWGKLVAESPTPVQRIYEQVHRVAIKQGLVNSSGDVNGSVVPTPAAAAPSMDYVSAAK